MKIVINNLPAKIERLYFADMDQHGKHSICKTCIHKNTLNVCKYLNCVTVLNLKPNGIVPLMFCRLHQTKGDLI